MQSLRLFFKNYGFTAGFVLLGVLLRLILLPSSSIWLDETYTIKTAARSLPGIIEVLRSDNGSPLFYFILHGWMKLFGSGETAVNLLTIFISGAALIATAFLLIEAFEDRHIHWTGIGLMALCPTSIHHATNVRFYALIVLISALAWLFFIRAVRRNRSIDWLLFAGCSLAGLYEHTLYLFTPFAQFAVLILFHRKRFISGLVSFAAIGIGFLPWLPVLIDQTLGYTGGETPDVIPRLSNYGGMLPAYLHTVADRVLVFSAVNTARLFVAGAMLLFITFKIWKERDNTNTQTARDFLFGHFFSVGMLVIVSLIRPVFWLDKYDLIALPLVFGLSGYAVSKLPFNQLVIILLLSINAVGTANYLHWRMTGELTSQRDTIELISREITDDDVLIAPGLSHFTVEYYLKELCGRDIPLYVFPAAQKERPAMIHHQALIDQRAALTDEAFQLLKNMSHTFTGRIYLFRSPLSGLDPLYDLLDQYAVLERTIPVKPHTWGPMYSEVSVYRLHNQEIKRIH